MKGCPLHCPLIRPHPPTDIIPFVFYFFTVVIQPQVAPAVSVSQMRQALGVKTTRCLSILLLICGGSMVAMQIICTAVVDDAGHHGAHVAGTGIWCGIFIVISGILGCCAAAKKTNALVSTMWLTRSLFILYLFQQYSWLIRFNVKGHLFFGFQRVLRALVFPYRNWNNRYF